MSTKRTTKNTSPNDELSWIVWILIIIFVIVIEVLGDYCNRHAEEHRKESWERFEKENARMMHMVNWDKAVYH